MVLNNTYQQRKESTYNMLETGESNGRIMKNNEEKNPKLLFVLFYDRCFRVRRQTSSPKTVV
jgi:hypothetical protein